MPKFFVEKIVDNKAFFVKDDEKHMRKSLRLNNGAIIVVSDFKGFDYKVKLNINEDEFYGEILEKEENKSEASINLTLYQALPKGEKFDLIIQKTTELGVNKIVPFLSSRSISRPTKKDFNKKAERYNKIIKEAAMQSNRGKIPILNELLTFEEAVSLAKKEDISLFFYENGKEKLNEIDFTAYKNIGVIIGCEGGFSSDEAEYIINEGIKEIYLGNRILRCETAAITAGSLIMHLSNNL